MKPAGRYVCSFCKQPSRDIRGTVLNGVATITCADCALAQAWQGSQYLAAILEIAGEQVQPSFPVRPTLVFWLADQFAYPSNPCFANEPQDWVKSFTGGFSAKIQAAALNRNKSHDNQS